MAYEMDFIGVSEETKDSTAICFRWKNTLGGYTVGVFDGGVSTYGKQLKEHLNDYYFENNDSDRIIDFVICSHPHLDHASGLTEILENFTVKKLYMNMPWIYVDELYDKITDGRITKDSLKARLRDDYKYIFELEKIADSKGIEIYPALEGTRIGDKLTVLSPSKEFYLELLVESSKTPLKEKNQVTESSAHSENVFRKIARYVKNLFESWSNEELREDVSTDPDNETSTVILGEMDEENFLLTGDVGIRGLDKAIIYADSIYKSLKGNVKLYEIPHHGSRRNVSPSILNRLIGDVVSENVETDIAAIVCSGKNSDHPLQIVKNAFIRRGVKVYVASGKTICHNKGDMPKRDGWSSMPREEFKTEVEEWS